MKKRWLLMTLVLCLGVVHAVEEPVSNPIVLESPALQEFLGERSAVFYALDLETNQAFVHSADRLNERNRPFSTFKIPNLLIALETGAEESLDSTREWNSELRPATEVWPEDWMQGQSLGSSFRKSVVWYFRDIALEVGGSEYRRWMEMFDYGNAQVPDDNDLFWLRGPLEISVVEQAEFIVGLLQDEFPVSETSMQMLVEVSRLDERDGYVLHGKTGAGSIGENWSGPFEGWLVGWVDRPDQAPVVFALFVEGPDFSSIRTFRMEMSLRLLQQADFWPE